MNCRTFSQSPAREEKATTTTTSFSSVQSLDRLGRRENTCVGRFSRDPLPVFSAGSRCEQSWHWQGRPLFDAVYPAFPLPADVLSLIEATRSRSGLTVPLSRHSVRTYPETSSYATPQGTFGRSRLSSLSHCGLILE